MGWFGAPAVAPICWATNVGLSHAMLPMNSLSAICWPVTPASSRVCLISGATRCL
jgi:hypothetical protein